MTRLSRRPDRRSVLKGAVAAGLSRLAAPFVIAARRDEPLKIGLVDPLAGAYAAVAPQAAAEANVKKLGRTVVGNELAPLRTNDFSACLIKARAANPDLLLALPQGTDRVNCLKQIARFAIDKPIHVAGLQQELESLEAMPPEARVGIRMMEWDWNQPADVPHVADFVATLRKRTGGKLPTARTWFGHASVYTLSASRRTARCRWSGRGRGIWRGSASCFPGRRSAAATAAAGSPAGSRRCRRSRGHCCSTPGS
jgi:ABC-type branched-subunit amino acid transport system substrate-binding protein